jgi:hypothetical protein
MFVSQFPRGTVQIFGIDTTSQNLIGEEIERSPILGNA